jgi:hypothetical protein
MSAVQNSNHEQPHGLGSIQEARDAKSRGKAATCELPNDPHPIKKSDVEGHTLTCWMGGSGNCPLKRPREFSPTVYWNEETPQEAIVPVSSGRTRDDSRRPSFIINCRWLCITCDTPRQKSQRHEMGEHSAKWASKRKKCVCQASEQRRIRDGKDMQADADTIMRARPRVRPLPQDIRASP